MTSPTQVLANQANALHSTGPVTEAGLSASSKNAITLGLYTRADFIRPGEEDTYTELCQSLLSDLDPTGTAERTLVDELVSATWRLRRCNIADAELGDFTNTDEPARRSIERARGAATSRYHRALNQLRNLQTNRIAGSMLPGDEVLDLRDNRKLQLFCVEQRRLNEKQSLDLLDQIMNAPLPSISEILREQAASDHVTPESSEASEAPETKAPEPEMASFCTSSFGARRNLPCPCGSGLKYKRCHLASDQAAALRRRKAA
jgi:hypothetical protein